MTTYIRRMRKLRPHATGLGQQRMCPSCGLITFSIKGKLYGMWQALYGRRVFDFKEMNRRFAHVSPELLG